MQGSEIRRWEENKMFLSLDPPVSACKGDREDKQRSFGGWISAKWPCLSSIVSLKKKENDNDNKHKQGMVNYKQSINKTALFNNSIVKHTVTQSHIADFKLHISRAYGKKTLLVTSSNNSPHRPDNRSLSSNIFGRDSSSLHFLPRHAVHKWVFRRQMILDAGTSPALRVL